MADIAVRAQSTHAAPLDYAIPGAQELLPKAVAANLDGTGAAGDFFPCLQILSPGGVVMFDAISTTVVAAGESVDATWFPGVTAAASSAFYPADAVFNFAFTLPANTSFFQPPAGSITNDDTQEFNWQGAYSIFSGGGESDITLVKEGMYFFSFRWFTWKDNTTTALATNPQDVSITNIFDLQSDGLNGARLTPANGQGLLVMFGRAPIVPLNTAWEFNNTDPAHSVWITGDLMIWRADPSNATS
jgi:hypothetical protein